MYLYLGSVRPGGARARYSCSLYILQFFNSSNRLFTQSFVSSLSFPTGSIRGKFEPRLTASLCWCSSSSRRLRGWRLVINLQMRKIFRKFVKLLAAVRVTDLPEHHIHDATVEDVLYVSHPAVSLQTALTTAVGLGLQLFHNFSGVHVLIVLINPNFIFRVLLSLLGFLQFRLGLRLLDWLGFLSYSFDLTGLASLHYVVLLDLGQMSL